MDEEEGGYWIRKKVDFGSELNRVAAAAGVEETCCKPQASLHWSLLLPWQWDRRS